MPPPILSGTRASPSRHPGALGTSLLGAAPPRAPGRAARRGPGRPVEVPVRDGEPRALPVRGPDAHRAAARGLALANGADPNGMLLQDIASAVGVPHGRQHFPILFVAARRERLGLCQMLLEFGADPNLRGYHGMRALHSACWRGNCRIVQLLIKRGANINLANERAPSHYSKLSQTGPPPPCPDYAPSWF